MLRPGSAPAKIVALAVLAILLLVVNQMIIQPLIGLYRDNQDHISRTSKLQQRYRALAAERPVLTRRLAAFADENDLHAAYLEGPSDALAAAELQDLAATAIGDASGEITSTQILPSVKVEDGPRLRQTGLKLRFSADIDGLAEALYDLETNEPYLFVDELLVVAGRGLPGKEEKTEPKLDIRLEIFGYVREEE